ncbi:hypothetical protein K474DRAFT_1624651 [Panus rudis PR-1116 ss-1]|nr:hypothetical protein K474DRAFT_1624651 [Panus rudis PR-1116 ss-1]
MDQESFRKLLQTPKASTSQPSPRNVLAGGSSKSKSKKTADSTTPAFKPRTVKKSAAGDAYRDRATERRQGAPSDFAQVEAVAEDFERLHAASSTDRAAVEEQRKYLGGDASHTVLVKGLDFALLEQTKAKLSAQDTTADDDTLEQAFIEGIKTAPKKRTREEMLRELKNKRLKAASGDAVNVENGESIDGQPTAIEDIVKLEEAKKAGKFKPIGFKPVGEEKSKKKVKKTKDGAEGKKKKKKEVAPTTDATGSKASAPSTDRPSTYETQANPQHASSSAPPPPPPPPPAEEPLDEDFDIFAGAGEYTGLDLGDESDSDTDKADKEQPDEKEEGETDAVPPRKWIDTDDEPRPVLRTTSEPKSRSPSRQRSEGPSQHKTPRASGSQSPHRRLDEDREEGEEEEERPIRLQPLTSSSVPSIRDILAMDEEQEKLEKRKARKEKNKKKKEGGGGGDITAKVERDYQRLKNYQEKKGASGSK